MSPQHFFVHVLANITFADQHMMTTAVDILFINNINCTLCLWQIQYKTNFILPGWVQNVFLQCNHMMSLCSLLTVEYKWSLRKDSLERKIKLLVIMLCLKSISIVSYLIFFLRSLSSSLKLAAAAEKVQSLQDVSKWVVRCSKWVLVFWRSFFFFLTFLFSLSIIVM